MDHIPNDAMATAFAAGIARQLTKLTIQTVSGVQAITIVRECANLKCLIMNEFWGRLLLLAIGQNSSLKMIGWPYMGIGFGARFGVQKLTAVVEESNALEYCLVALNNFPNHVEQETMEEWDAAYPARTDEDRKGRC